MANARVNWDPVLQSAVSDLEGKTKKRRPAVAIDTRFADGPQTVNGELVKGLTVATTWPETMLGDGR